MTSRSVASIGALTLGLLLGCGTNDGSSGGFGSGGDGGTTSSGGSSGGGSSGGSNSGGSSGGTSSGASSSGGSSSGGGSSGGTSGGGSSGASSSGGSSGGSSGSSSGSTPVVNWPSAACQQMAANLVSQMSTQQKAAQMVMAPVRGAFMTTPMDVQNTAVGAAFAPGGAQPASGTGPTDWANLTDQYYQAASQAPLGIPILYGLDTVHGNNGETGTVIFPHNAGLASSRDANLVTQVEQITAYESVATGITWSFAPFMGVTWDYRWGRTYESFSEDPQWDAEMATAAVIGLQGPNGPGSGTPGVAPGVVACAKHWAGDGQASPPSSKPPGIVDRGNVMIDLATMQSVGMAPYIPAIQAGLGCVMVSDARWNGASMTSNSQLITDQLKGMYGFKGFVVTDWDAAVDSAGGIEATINAGVDMLMQPDGWQNAINTIANSTAISMDRINDAVTRILQVKCQAGLFNYKRDPSMLANVGSADHRALGRKAVAQSLVLLQNNNNVLPLPKTSKVWVGGGGANNLDLQCGGWTISWQGSGSQTQGTTIQQAISKVTQPVANMSDADVAIVVLSEPKPYAEMMGDSPTLNTIPASDFALLDQAKSAGKKVVAVVLSGRPVLITDHIGSADAWIAAWLPGTEGDGVADVLFGDFKPTGKLSHSWPRDDNSYNINCCNGMYNPLFPLGFGLSY